MKKGKWLVVGIMMAGSVRGGVVADTLYRECRGEPLEGQLAVASVIWNRAQNSGRALETVCLARKQFSCWNGGYTKVKTAGAADKVLMKRFEAIEAQMKAGTFQPTGVWTHYHRTDVHPVWSDGMTDKKVIGRHLFGKTK